VSAELAVSPPLEEPREEIRNSETPSGGEPRPKTPPAVETEPREKTPPLESGGHRTPPEEIELPSTVPSQPGSMVSGSERKEE
jgi:hypothetical protein